MIKEQDTMNSDLGPNGYATPETSLGWVASVVSRACLQGDAERARIYVYAYRHPTKYLAVDIVSERGGRVPLTFHTGSGTLLDDSDPCVTDLAEAIHLTGMIAQSMGVRIDLGLTMRPEDLTVIRSRTSEGR